jgi:Carbonic anhydrases/acetyltransferases, isoleucine patch superfamily
MPIKPFDEKYPDIHPESYYAENATIVGDVTVAAGASIWYGAVVRGDYSPIRVGENTCVEDNVMIHGTVHLGGHCVVGHGAMLHSCVVENDCLIGMGAIVLDGCVVGEGSIIAAGTLVHRSLEIPPNSMVMGKPAAVVRTVRPEERAQTVSDAVDYIEYAQKQLIRFGESL